MTFSRADLILYYNIALSLFLSPKERMPSVWVWVFFHYISEPVVKMIEVRAFYLNVLVNFEMKN
jgi:hypothetical protein